LSILAIDIGGTNSRFSLFSGSNFNLNFIDSIWFKTSEYKSFDDLLCELKISKFSNFINEIEVVVCAAAGPVIDHIYCKPPNIDWIIEKSDIDKNFPKSINFLINDFLAQSFAVFTELRTKAILIKKGITKDGICGVIGPGTGLGKSFLNKSSSNLISGFPSEGGHANFPITSIEEYEICEFYKSKMKIKEVSCEDILCGKSLETLYEFFYSEKLEVSEVSKRIKNSLAPKVSNFYSKVLARVCKNFALDIFAEAGILIAGGVLTKTPELLEKSIFEKEFCNSSTQKDFLKNIKVESFSNEDSGLWGAANYGMQMLKKS